MLSLLTLAAVAAAQSVGGIIPAGIAQPNTTGFENPTIQPARGGYAICVSGTVPVTASAQNVALNFEIPQNQTQVTQTFLSYITSGSTYPASLMGGMQNVSGTYNISATMCMPANGTMSDTVQFLTHGVGFDRYYWDFAPGYSYVDYAALQGYATFFYDRLGVGMSSKPDPIATVQSPLEVEIAAQLIKMLRSSYFGMNFTSVVGTGHSFGSIITQAITARHPTLLDAAILTGFSLNSTGLPPFFLGSNFAIASQNQPYRFSALNNGYLVSGSAISNQIDFFKAPGFDPNILSLAEATKGSVTFGELFTTGTVIAPASNYTGYVAVVDGDADLPFCLGNCTYPVNHAAQVQPALYANAKNASNSYLILSDTGHGINLHYSAMQAYEFIQNFIKTNL